MDILQRVFKCGKLVFLTYKMGNVVGKSGAVNRCKSLRNIGDKHIRGQTLGKTVNRPQKMRIGSLYKLRRVHFLACKTAAHLAGENVFLPLGECLKGKAVVVKHNCESVAVVTDNDLVDNKPLPYPCGRHFLYDHSLYDSVFIDLRRLYLHRLRIVNVASRIMLQQVTHSINIQFFIQPGTFCADPVKLGDR